MKNDSKCDKCKTKDAVVFINNDEKYCMDCAFEERNGSKILKSDKAVKFEI